MKRTSAELKRRARQNLTGHYGLPMGAMVLMGLITWAILMPFSIVFMFSRSTAIFWIYEASVIIISLLSSVLSVGLTRIHLQLARKNTPSLADLFYGFRRNPDRFLLSALLMAIVSFVCGLPGTICSSLAAFSQSTPLLVCSYFLAIGGSLLAMVLLLPFALVYLLLMDRPSIGVLDAFRTSARLMQGNKGRLFYIYLSFFGWFALCVLSCYIGLLWVSPYLSQVLVTFYQDVSGELDHAPEKEDPFSEALFGNV